MIDYYLRADLYEGTELNGIKQEMFVQVAVVSDRGSSQQKKTQDKNSSVHWYEVLASKTGRKDHAIGGSFKLPEGWENYPHLQNKSHPLPIPDVFIYLSIKSGFKDETEQVSYCRIPLTQIIPRGSKRNWSNAPKWYDMKENLALDKYKDNVFPGSILLGINAGPKSDIAAELNNGNTVPAPIDCRPFENDDLPKTPQLVTFDDDKKNADDDVLEITPPPEQKKQEKQQQKQEKRKSKYANVTIQIIEACHLAPLDGHTSDPFCKVIVQGRKKNDRIEKEIDPIKKTLDPKWNQDLEFSKVEIGDSVSIRIIDWDRMGDDDIGYIDPFVLKGVNEKKWFKIKPSKAVEKKLRKKPHLYSNMKIKIGVKYEWDDLNLNEDEREEKKKKKLFGFMPSSINKSLSKIGGKDKQKKEIIKLKQPHRQRMELRCYIYQARDLENADASGLSDAYLVVRFCGRDQKTKTIEDHIDPQWYSSMKLDVDVPTPLEYAPSIYCEVYDADDFGKDQSLGRFTVPADLCWTVYEDKNNDDWNDKNRGLPTPIWYDLVSGEGFKVSGSVLCAFELIDIKQKDYKQPIINPPCKMERKWAHIITLGLRDIQSMFGVHKSFIEFESNGSLYKTSTSNLPDSRNPNFCQILHFEINLPVEKIFLPNLNICMKDSFCGGLIKRKLGHASIEIEDLMYNRSNFKTTKEETESNQIRNEAKSELRLYENENEEKKERAEDGKILSRSKSNMHEDAFAQGDVAGIIMQFTTNDKRNRSGGDDAETPLIGKNKELEKTNKNSRLFIPNKGSLNYEYNKKNTYDLTKTLADYMQDRNSFGNELEDEMDLKPFLQIPLFHGHTNRKHMSNVGYFKGLITFNDSKRDIGDSDSILKEITTPINLYLRLYILEGMKLVPQDTNGLADPYIIIRIGNTKITTRDDHFSNTLSPEFYYGVEIPITLPGASKVQIEIWDWDGIGDDLIGSTCIDIEDRWYSASWRKLKKKALEERTLWNDQSSVSQGKLSLWCELLTITDGKRYPLIDIKPPPPDPYELRVIVWECKDCPIMDETTNMNDLYITGGLDINNDDGHDDNDEFYFKHDRVQQTDLHFRSQNGKGSFNWRMKFPIQLPKRKFNDYPNFRVQIWDRDFFSPSDNIAEAVIPLQPFLRYCEKHSKHKRCVLTKDSDDKFWIDLSAKGGGQIRLSFELLPGNIAKLMPAGFGRKEPNINPFLPEPEGRAQFSLLNPCQSLRNLLGDKLCAKLCLAFCGIICIAFLIFITPNLVSAIMANLLTSL